MGLLDRLLGREPAPPVQTASGAVRDSFSDPSKLVRSSSASLYQSTAAMFNGVTGLGTQRDPSFFNRFAMPRRLSDGERFGAGRNALIKQTLTKLPSTATREGWRTVITDERVEDPEVRENISDKIAAYEKRLNIQGHSAVAGSRANQYGEALILLGVEDGRAWDQPVDWANVKTIRWAAVIDRRDYFAYKMFPATDEGFGQVEQFWITDINGVLSDGLRYGEDSVSIPYNELAVASEAQERGGTQLVFHADRVLHFHTDDYYSILDSLQDALGGYLTAMSGVTTAARESSMTKYTIDSWLKKMWSENSRLSQVHMELVDRAKNVLNAWVVDKEHEDVEFAGRNLSGVDKLPNPSMVHVSAALDQPVTEFWGVSPNGFNTGEAAQQSWHASVHAYQELVVAPRIMHVDKLILVAEDGAQQPGDLERKILFGDLSPPDEETRSKLRSEALDDIRGLVDGDLISREEARPAIAALSDDYFRPAIDLEADEQPPTAPVGVFTGTTAILQAAYPNGVPPSSARAALLALAPTYFTQENIDDLIPMQGASDPIEEGGGVGGGSPALGDEEDADTDTEGEQWAKSPLPADAMEARAIAKKLTIPTVRITRAHRAGLIEGWKYLGGKPRYSYSEVEQAILRGNGKLPEEPALEPDSNATADKARDAEPEVHAAAVVLRLPSELARFVPYKADDTSAPHITLLYLGKKIPPAKVVPLLDGVRSVLARTPALDIELDGVDYFEDNGKGQRVAFVRVAPSLALTELHAALRKVVGQIGLEVPRPGHAFVPHVTLAYLAPGEPYVGPAPEGLWTAEHAELWYDDLALSQVLAPQRRLAPPVIDVVASKSGDTFDRAYAAALGYVDELEAADVAADAYRDLSEEAKRKRIDEAFTKYHAAVNMGAAALEAWSKTKWSKKASVSREPIARNLRLLRKPKSEWTLADAKSALRTVGFVSRMKGAEQGEPVKIDGREGPSRRDISLKNWAFDPAKR